jgi:hypothetical protein
MLYRYSSSVKPFINVRGLNLYPAPDYLLSSVEVLHEPDFVPGLIVEVKDDDTDFVQVFPMENGSVQTVETELVKPIVEALQSDTEPVVETPATPEVPPTVELAPEPVVDETPTTVETSEPLPIAELAKKKGAKE